LPFETSTPPPLGISINLSQGGYSILWNCIFYIDFTRPIQVMENLESHGIYYFNFQAWKVIEFKCMPWKFVEKLVMPLENKKEKRQKIEKKNR